MSAPESGSEGGLWCFVIMPFAAEFKETFGFIQESVKSALGETCTCTRLDDDHNLHAGSIIERLLENLHRAAFCIVDVTDLNANVMWELGYAMALRKPCILITRRIDSLPFDINVMQAIAYNAGDTDGALRARLAVSIRNTIDHARRQLAAWQTTENHLARMERQIRDLNSMVSVAVPGYQTHTVTRLADLQALEGAWRSPDTHTYLFARVVHGELIAPYCYSGYDTLDAVYYDYRLTGDHWFARYCWFRRPVHGFSFLREISTSQLEGAWWSDWAVGETPSTPPRKSGISVVWERIEMQPPLWAEDFWRRVEVSGIQRLLPASAAPFESNGGSAEAIAVRVRRKLLTIAERIGQKLWD